MIRMLPLSPLEHHGVHLGGNLSCSWTFAVAKCLLASLRTKSETLPNLPDQVDCFCAFLLENVWVLGRFWLKTDFHLSLPLVKEHIGKLRWTHLPLIPIGYWPKVPFTKSLRCLLNVHLSWDNFATESLGLWAQITARTVDNTLSRYPRKERVPSYLGNVMGWVISSSIIWWQGSA